MRSKQWLVRRQLLSPQEGDQAPPCRSGSDASAQPRGEEPPLLPHAPPHAHAGAAPFQSSHICISWLRAGKASNFLLISVFTFLRRKEQIKQKCTFLSPQEIPAKQLEAEGKINGKLAAAPKAPRAGGPRLHPVCVGVKRPRSGMPGAPMTGDAGLCIPARRPRSQSTNHKA